MTAFTASGTFEVQLSPAAGEVGGSVGRFDLTKTWHGDLQGSGSGLMLSAGNPAAGDAGYVAIETFIGTLHEREGSFAFAQFGLMEGGQPTLTYRVVPGSGIGELSGIRGVLDLVIEEGEHRYTLTYDLD